MCSWASLVFVSQINRMLQLGELLQLLVIVFIMFYILASLIFNFLNLTSMCLLGELQFPSDGSRGGASGSSDIRFRVCSLVIITSTLN